MMVIIAESDSEIVDSIRLAFSNAFDCELIMTNSGKECLDMVKDSSSDIVILGDLYDMASLNVIKQIRNYSWAPIMVLSCIDDEPSIKKAFDLGADGYMTKPIRQLELIERVKAILRRSLGRNAYVGC